MVSIPQVRYLHSCHAWLLPGQLSRVCSAFYQNLWKRASYLICTTCRRGLKLASHTVHMLERGWRNMGCLSGCQHEEASSCCGIKSSKEDTICQHKLSGLKFFELYLVKEPKIWRDTFSLKATNWNGCYQIELCFIRDWKAFVKTCLIHWQGINLLINVCRIN